MGLATLHPSVSKEQICQWVNDFWGDWAQLNIVKQQTRQLDHTNPDDLNFDLSRPFPDLVFLKALLGYIETMSGLVLLDEMVGADQLCTINLIYDRICQLHDRQIFSKKE